MEFREYQALVREIPLGKKLPDAIYLHESALEQLPARLAKHIAQTINGLALDERDWNIVKFSKNDHKITLLNYPKFFDDAYPALDRSFTIDLEELSVRESDYSKSTNPPILHRKETFLAPDHPYVATFSKITEEGVKAGLYENTRNIGFRKNWENLISRKGYTLDSEGRLRPKCDVGQTNIPIPDTEIKVKRHLTAINRDKLSAPMQLLARHNYLNGNWTVLDYGSGKGDDMRELEAHGINVSGWDPVHYPDGTLTNSDIVNLGFVLNVIEDRQERDETLRRAWKYADKLLIIAVMIAGESLIQQFTPYKDGVITSRRTFQKYYSQSEIRSYVETILGENPIAVGQGIFIVFKNKMEEQLFLLERQYIKRDWQQKTQRQIKTREPAVRKDIIDKHLELFTDFWETSLELGRIPANNEFEFSDQIRRIAGSHNNVHQLLVEHFGSKLFEEAQQKRKDDLIVYFALGLFGKRKPQTKMPDRLRRDIKYFYNSYNEAIEQSREVLFSMSDRKLIEKMCNKAYEQIQTGQIMEGHSYTFHKKYLGDLPPELRIYIGCATQLYGDLDNIHLIKAHMTSSKVSLMRYDDWNKDTPLLVERIKIKMREQDVDFFDYGEKFTPPPLENKDVFT